MWPAALWMGYEKAIRRAAGMGRAPVGRDPDSYDKTYAHCDVLVIGAGPAGLAAALGAARTGARVILAEQDFELGGALLGSAEETIDGAPALDWVAAAERELLDNDEVRLLRRTSAYAYFDHNFLGLMERVTDHLEAPPEDLPRHRLWKVRARQVVLATGAIERPLVFADNDRPGIMLAGACQTYVNRYAVRPGARAVVFTNNDGAYGAALDLKAAGIEIAAVVDLRSEPEGPYTEAAEAAGIPVLAHHAIAGTTGGQRVKSVRVAPLSNEGDRVFGAGEAIDCDLVAVSGGWSPTVHLFCQSKGQLEWAEDLGCFVPGGSVQAERSAGACNGAFGLAACLDQGTAAGLAAANACGIETAGQKTRAPAASDRGFLPARWLWLVPSDKPVGQGGKHFVDHQNDVTAADLKLALREGYSSIEHVNLGRATAPSSTSSATPPPAWARTRARPATSTQSAWWPRSWAAPCPRSGSPPTGRPIRRSPSESSPGGTWTGCWTRSARPRSTAGTNGPAPPSRTWASGAAPGTTRATAKACIRRCAGKSRRCARRSASWTPRPWARSTSGAPTWPSCSTGSTPTPGPSWRWGAAATA
jgi:sarcosine oxidase subunit alpha